MQLIPVPKQDACAQGHWQQAAPNADQIMPLCHRWNVRVTLAKEAPTALLVGGAVLSTDGSILGFPADGRKVLLKPGESTTFNAPKETFRAGPPLEVWDQLMVFGTQEKNPVRWDLLTSTAPTRGSETPTTGLYGALYKYLHPGTRGVSVAA